MLRIGREGARIDRHPDRLSVVIFEELSENTAGVKGFCPIGQGGGSPAVDGKNGCFRVARKGIADFHEHALLLPGGILREVKGSPAHVEAHVVPAPAPLFRKTVHHFDGGLQQQGPAGRRPASAIPVHAGPAGSLEQVAGFEVGPHEVARFVHFLPFVPVVEGVEPADGVLFVPGVPEANAERSVNDSGSDVGRAQPLFIQGVRRLEPTVLSGDGDGEQQQHEDAKNAGR